MLFARRRSSPSSGPAPSLDVTEHLGQELVVSACEPLTVSSPSTKGMERPPASCPMLECAGPWIEPVADSESTYSSKVRMSTS